jgi:hypothetical protein
MPSIATVSFWGIPFVAFWPARVVFPTAAPAAKQTSSSRRRRPAIGVEIHEAKFD